MTRQTYDTFSRILLHSFLLLAAFQIFSFVMLAFCNDWVYSFHSRLFPMSHEAFTIIGYSFLGLMKIVGVTLFLVPWIAMRINAKRVSD